VGIRPAPTRRMDPGAAGPKWVGARLRAGPAGRLCRWPPPLAGGGYRTSGPVPAELARAHAGNCGGTAERPSAHWAEGFCVGPPAQLRWHRGEVPALTGWGPVPSSQPGLEVDAMSVKPRQGAASRTGRGRAHGGGRGPSDAPSALLTGARDGRQPSQAAPAPGPSAASVLRGGFVP